MLPDREGREAWRVTGRARLASRLFGRIIWEALPGSFLGCWIGGALCTNALAIYNRAIGLPGRGPWRAAMVGGLLVGLEHQSAARFSFLLATPIILAAGVLEVPKLLQPAARESLGPAVIGGVVAGVLAYASTALLMRYFKQQEVNALLPFSAYCVLLGLAALVFGH